MIFQRIWLTKLWKPMVQCINSVDSLKRTRMKNLRSPLQSFEGGLYTGIEIMCVPVFISQYQWDDDPQQGKQLNMSWAVQLKSFPPCCLCWPYLACQTPFWLVGHLLFKFYWLIEIGIHISMIIPHFLIFQNNSPNVVDSMTLLNKAPEQPVSAPAALTGCLVAYWPLSIGWRGCCSYPLQSVHTY